MGVSFPQLQPAARAGNMVQLHCQNYASIYINSVMEARAGEYPAQLPLVLVLSQLQGLYHVLGSPAPNHCYHTMFSR
jgi:hypothetical protein